MTGYDRNNYPSGHNISSDSESPNRNNYNRKNALSSNTLSGLDIALPAGYKAKNYDRKVSISKERIKAVRSSAFISLIAIFERRRNQPK